MSHDYPYHAGKNLVSEIRGDLDPNKFDFNETLTDAELLKLYERNEIIQLACDYTVTEALKRWVTFDVDQDVTVDKWGTNYTFTAKGEKQAFNRYLEWLGFPIKLKEGIGWARLLGQSIAVFWDEQNPIENYKYVSKEGNKWEGEHVLNEGIYFPPNKEDIYIDFTCFHRYINGNGYEVVDADPDGKPLLYKIKIQTEVMRKQRTYFIPTERVVELNNPRKRLQYGGSSKVQGLAKYALIGEQMLRRLLSRLHKLSGGIFYMPGVQSGAQATAQANALGDITALDKLFGGLEGKPEWLVPDLKTGQFDQIHQILTRTMSRALRLSQKLMDGESQGNVSSAAYDVFTSYTEMEGIQMHFYRAVEEMFHKLGKEDPTYEWNPIIPGMDDDNEPIGAINMNINNRGFGNEEKEGLDESESDTSDTKSTNTKEKSKK